MAALAIGVVSALVLTGLFAVPGGAWGLLGPLGQIGAPATATLGSATATPTETSAPSLPGPPPTPTHTPVRPSSPQGCGPTGAAPRPPAYSINSATDLAGARGEVALTFDDGPAPYYTRQILDELKAAGAHATFFDVGEHAQRYPDLVRAELAGGNAIGNHTYTHQDLAGRSVDDVREQLTTTTATLRHITGDPCLWLFRPPCGLYDARTIAEARHEGLTAMLWDVWALDWERPGTSVIEQRVIENLHSGAIILLHDGGSSTFTPDRHQTADALPAILRAIRARGLRAVTLPKLLMDAGLVRLPGTHAAPPATPVPPPASDAPLGPEGALTPADMALPRPAYG